MAKWTKISLYVIIYNEFINKVGDRVAKIDEWLEQDKLLLLEGWSRDGLTNEQIANNIGINVKTLYDWKNKESNICNALKKGKEVVDIEVENALFKKAIGYNTVVKKAFKLKDIVYGDNGKKISENERIEYAEEEIHIPADTTAQIFWLKNRKKAQWRDKVEYEANTDELNKVKELLGKIQEGANNE